MSKEAKSESNDELMRREMFGCAISLLDPCLQSDHFSEETTLITAAVAIIIRAWSRLNEVK